ncbi:MAG: hypothetical protein P4L35_04390 [Ignavibacteriaceae bacterium]|nr:hypothetical protein [Ignavibacteriaceae bacterium]
MCDLYIIFKPFSITPKNPILEDSIKSYFKNKIDGIEIEPHIFYDLKNPELIKLLSPISHPAKICYYYIDYANLSKDTFDMLQNVNISEFNESNASYLRNEIKNEVYHNIVSEYSHGAGKDLVNSLLGVINVWCFNPDNRELDQILLDQEKNSIIEPSLIKIEMLQDTFNKMEDYEEYPLFQDHLILNKDLVKKITKALERLQLLYINKQLSEFLSSDKKQLSDNLFRIFSFISRYAHDQRI